jgi:uncharacterized protein YprB with RNaseH-like and TPR domain
MSKKKTWSAVDVEKLNYLRLDKKLSWEEIAEEFVGLTPNGARKAFYRYMKTDTKPKTFPELKFLTIDIESKPIKGYFWGTWDQNIPTEMIIEDWTILSFSAKWLHNDEVIYMDTSKQKDVTDDSLLVMELHRLLNEATVILTQNGKRFDIPKINSRFKVYDLPPVSPFLHIDALRINRRHFGDTSNKLDYQTNKFCKMYKKSGHKKFPGNQLWIQCLAGNKEAWVEMKDYNQIDVLSLEELYLTKLRKWDNTVNFNVFREDQEYVCSCGSSDFYENGFAYTKTGKFQIHTCTKCGSHHQDKVNLLTKEKRKALKK